MCGTIFTAGKYNNNANKDYCLSLQYSLMFVTYGPLPAGTEVGQQSITCMFATHVSWR